MKNLKTWQKAGLVAAIVGGLTLGGFTPNYSSKGLESKLPTIGMSVAEAKEVKAEGWETPDFSGYHFVKEADLDMSDKIPGKETKAELWKNEYGDSIHKLKFKGEIYGYSYVKQNKKEGYGIIASKQKGVYDEKYELTENMEVPNRLI